MGQRPGDRLQAEFAVGYGDVGTSTVFEVAGNRVVVVTIYGRDVPLGDQGYDLIGMRTVADQIAAAVAARQSEIVDACQRGLQRGQVAVNISDNGNRVHVHISLSRPACRCGSRVGSCRRTPGTGR
jgi:hypothetical protein